MFADESGVFTVVLNDEQQHSFGPTGSEVPLGGGVRERWGPGRTVFHIEQVTDLHPALVLMNGRRPPLMPARQGYRSL